MTKSSIRATGGTMADSKTKDEPISSIDDAVRVKDLSSPITNPNIPRSVFREPLGAAVGDADEGYLSVTDGTFAPGSGFKEKSIKAQAVQMKTSFDANGQSGNAGDWLVNVDGHWFIAKNI